MRGKTERSCDTFDCLETQGRNAVAPPCLHSRINIYDGQFVVEVSRHNFHVQVVEDEETEALTRCLHFVLPLAELGLAFIKTRDFSEYLTLCYQCLLNGVSLMKIQFPYLANTLMLADLMRVMFYVWLATSTTNGDTTLCRERSSLSLLARLSMLFTKAASKYCAYSLD